MGSVDNKWAGMETAPKDGTEIELMFSEQEICLGFWSERPVCMAGNTNGGCPPGWATSKGSGIDYNLPLDTPMFWRPAAVKEERTQDELFKGKIRKYFEANLEGSLQSDRKRRLLFDIVWQSATHSINEEKADEQGVFCSHCDDYPCTCNKDEQYQLFKQMLNDYQSFADLGEEWSWEDLIECWKSKYLISKK
jgi:hypothetical protein